MSQLTKKVLIVLFFPISLLFIGVHKSIKEFKE